MKVAREADSLQASLSAAHHVREGLEEELRLIRDGEKERKAAASSLRGQVEEAKRRAKEAWERCAGAEEDGDRLRNQIVALEAQVTFCACSLCFSSILGVAC